MQTKVIKIPNYSLGEEIFNFVSHVVGAAFGIIILFVNIYLAVINKLNVKEMVALIIYGISIITLFTISAIYHGLSKRCVGKKIFRILDHSTIFFLIFGTYFPICTIALSNSEYEILILTIEASIFIIGIIINSLFFKYKPARIISIILYAISGWAIILFPNAILLLTKEQFLLILIGGITYTIGILFYCLGKHIKWSHSIFHIIVVMACIIQYIGIFLMI